MNFARYRIPSTGYRKYRGFLSTGYRIPKSGILFSVPNTGYRNPVFYFGYRIPDAEYRTFGQKPNINLVFNLRNF